jgi:hypothetical protein
MTASVSLNGNIQATDNVTGTVALTKIFSGLVCTANAFLENAAGSCDTSGEVQSLPVSTVNFVYVKNLHATQTISVSVTPSGGSLEPACVLPPSSAFIYVASASGGGLTEVKLIGSGSGTTFESVFAG